MPEMPTSRDAATVPDTCNVVMCRYNEIALKGGNRGRFERLFQESIVRSLPEINRLRFLNDRGRVMAHLPDFESFTAAQLGHIRTGLTHVFGLVSFSPGYVVSHNLQAIETCIDKTFPERYEQAVGNQKDGRRIRYRMRARRSDKSFPVTSTELEMHFAERILPTYPDLVLDLNNADLSIGVEVRREWVFVYYDSVSGPGGLPIGSNDAAVALLSGGIDSPVACYLTMKRGVALHYLTFHSYPYTTDDSVSKVCRIVQKLNRYQRRGDLFGCNLVPIQKAIRDGCDERLRTVLYRRFMMRIATALAHDRGVEALVTGDAIGQVASQTIRNLRVIGDVTDLAIMRPLKAMDKQETMAIARQIGTLAISEEAYPDSCTVFAPRSPSTRASMPRIVKNESWLPVDELVADAVSSIKTIDPQSGKEYACGIGQPYVVTA